MSKPEDIYSHRFKEKLKEHLDKNRFTQQQIANKAGLSQAALSLILTGMRAPTFRSACRIANAFKEPLSNFF